MALSDMLSYLLLTVLVLGDPCESVTCHTGGTGEIQNEDFWCECSKGWTGRNCNLNGKYWFICSHQRIDFDIK